MTDFKIEQKDFSGPLHLLLELIENKEKIITDVSLSEVTEEFLEYMDAIPEQNTEELVDFLVIAAKLLLLKSRNILPNQAEDAENAIPLEQQLKLYKEFAVASEKINRIWNEGKIALARNVKIDLKPGFYPPENIGVKDLLQSVKNALDKIVPIFTLPKSRIAKAISIKEKITQIRNFLLQKGGVANLSEIFKHTKDKTEIIMSFLALLELVKQKNVELFQYKLFGDIKINIYESTGKN